VIKNTKKKDKLKFAQHLLDSKHAIGPTENIMDIINITNKGKTLNIIEKFYIYKETKIVNQLNSTFIAKPNKILGALILKNEDRGHVTPQKTGSLFSTSVTGFT
jgi:hypothetical protein